MITEVLTWTDEVTPTIEQHGDWENPDERVTFRHDPRLTKPVIERLERLANDQFDEGTCEAEGCTQAIGFVLIEPEDNGLGGGTPWRWVTVVTAHGRILLVCEECSPTNVYPIPQES